jgi:two-component system LytT family response regulator
MTALIVEDELHSREFLKTLVTTYCDGVRVVGAAEIVPEAIRLIDDLHPDLVFLDIEMQSGTGFDVLQGVKRRDFDVVFTTAYDHYALQAIKFSAVDYLLKPIDIDELRGAVEKVRQRRSQPQPNAALERLLENLANPDPDRQTITLATLDGLEFVPLAHIIRLEAAGAYTTFFLKDGRKIMVSKNLKEYENLLPPRQFFRIHNSHLINLAEVKRMIKTDGGYAVMKDDSVVMISPKKRDEFLQLMTGRGAS